MKKFLAFLLTIALLVPCFAMTSFAASSDISVGSLYFVVDTSGFQAGEETDGFDRHNVKVSVTGATADTSGFVWTFPSTDSTYPNLVVTINDLQCTSDTVLKVGDTVKFKFWVSVSGAKETGKYYYINSSTKAHVSSGDNTPKVKSVSKTRSGDELVVTVTTNAIKGAYSEPSDLEWAAGQLGQAHWAAPEDGNGEGYYDVKLKRDDKTVTTFKTYNATSINLYPWMTKEGDYSFEVRTVPNGTSGAKASEWTESDSQDVPKEKVSDGSGQNASGGSSSSGGNSGGQVGWRQVNGTWYFYYPDGSMKKNGWEKVSNKWYYFDATGAMQKGWKTVGANTYYLDSNNGDMKSGWVKTSDGQWYYLNSTENDSNYGAMLKNQWLDYKNNRYYLKDSGAMATGWLKIGDAYYHFNSDGALSVSTTIDGFKVDSNGRWLQGQ